MPMIRVELLEGRSVEQKRAFAEVVTDKAAEILGCGKDAVSIVFVDTARHDWATGGVLRSDS